MIQVSLSILLVFYAAILAAFVIFALFNLYHLFAYGFLSFLSFFTTFMFLAATVLILFITYAFAVQIDWTQTFII